MAPLAVNVTHISRDTVSAQQSEQPELVGRAVATILDTPSGYREPGTGGWGRSATYQPAMNPADLASHLCHWNSQEAAAEDSAEPIALGDNLVSTPWSFLCFKNADPRRLATSDPTQLVSFFKELLQPRWIGPRVCSLAEHPKELPIMVLVVLTTSQNKYAADRGLMDRLATGAATALKCLTKLPPPTMQASAWPAYGTMTGLSGINPPLLCS